MTGLKLKAYVNKYWTILVFFGISLAFIMAAFNSLSPSTPTLSYCHSSNCTVSGIQLINGCGSGPSGFVSTSINFGCKGNTCGSNLTGSPGTYCDAYHNGISDLLFAIIRFLSDGVGLVVIASVIVGGIQYIVSRGDPNATQLAVKRLTSAGLALVIFIFAYALLNYIVPAGFFKQ